MVKFRNDLPPKKEKPKIFTAKEKKELEKLFEELSKILRKELEYAKNQRGVNYSP